MRTVLDPNHLAFCKPDKTFLDFPDVDNPIASPRVFLSLYYFNKLKMIDHLTMLKRQIGFETNEIALIAVQSGKSECTSQAYKKLSHMGLSRTIPNIAALI